MLFIAWVVCAAFIFKLFWNVSIRFDAAIEQAKRNERRSLSIKPQFEICLLAAVLLLYWWAGSFPFNLGFVGSLAAGLGLIAASYFVIPPARFIYSHVARWLKLR